MSRSKLVLLTGLFLCCLGLLGCAEGAGDSADATGEPAYTVTFRDRTIDLEPFLIGFPYSGHRADLEHGEIFYFERTEEGSWLRRQELGTGGTIDHEKGVRVNGIDWSKHTFNGGRLHPASNRLFITSDEANDEHLNVYAIDLDGGEVEQITHNDYTYSWNLSDDGRWLAYLKRTGLKEPLVTALHIRDLESGEDREILSDEGGDDRYTWSYIRFAPDNRSVVLTVQHDGQRNTKSLAHIDLQAKQPKFEYIHPPRKVRYNVGQIEGWLSDTAFLYTSAEEGFDNIYRYDMASGETKQLTDLSEDLGSTELLETEPPTLLTVLRRPHESLLQVRDAASGKLLREETIPASVGIMDGYESHALISYNSLTTPWLGRRLEVRRELDQVELAWSDFGGIPDSLEQQISHYDVEKVAYPTFDKGPDGKPRMLHGFLMTPKNPPPPDQRLVRITSFYGGGNRFDTQSQIMAAAGIATFSPSPRGSSGFGAEFAALNDGDLGGDEIVDIIYAAKWLQDVKGYAPQQIGVYGGSHGGYATMRALTFPPETNGRNASFPFGFGWSHAGFSNILTFYESCNIPDWVVKEAGDPATENAKLLDRSPISHVDLLQAPILLTHGSNDWRVPTDESRRFVAKAEELGKPVTYVEFEGQGHGIRGFENLVRYYQAVLSFYEGLGQKQEHREAA